MIDTVAVPSQDHQHEAFLSMLPELESRCTRMARSYSKSARRDAADDALAAAFLNHRQAVGRGRRLTPQQLGWGALMHLKHRSIVARQSYPSRHEAPVSFEDDADRKQARAIALALTTEHDDPAVRVQVRIDWRALAMRLPRRLRRIVIMLACGHAKGEIAARLRISRGRLSQNLEDLRREIMGYFDYDLPVAA